MMQRNLAKADDLRAQADSHLNDIGDLKVNIAYLETQYAKEVEVIKQKYIAEINRLEDSLAMEEKALITLMKKNKAALFDGTDKVRLPSGSLLYTKEPTLTLPRNALERMKDQGWTDAIKIAESVDRGVVAKWPLERIVAIGGDMRPTEKFAYELKDK
ncbi:MAG TPA: host-nuclease inhibitor Gam family protein [Thermodesulfobacteriota bacterium]|nr:host-nuclease inhibitor Gam family protein [Thermodesulfobacteriota bacterium]HNU70388.1 host-nuclease inhibitor Gam family protein [Thermodesulfobacteriota bacterium]